MAPFLELDQMLRAAGIPIDGISIGNSKDKSTWRVNFLESATSEQRTLAGNIVNFFDPAKVVKLKSEIEILKEEVVQLKAQMAEVAKLIPAVNTVQAKLRS